MKLKLPNTQATKVLDQDERKKTRLLKRFTKRSNDVRKAELKALRKTAPQSRLNAPASVQLVPPVQSPAPTVKASLTLNLSGNRRGMHNAHDSEHMKKIRAMRKMYNPQMPVLTCSSCAYSTSCPAAKPGYECAFLPFLNSHRIEDEHDLVHYMKDMVGSGARRVQLALLQETLSGGKPDFETTEAMNLLFTQMKSLNDTLVDRAEIKIESTDGSIIGRLFGGLDQLVNQTRKEQESRIEVPPPRIEIQDIPTEQMSQMDILAGQPNKDLLLDYAKGSGLAYVKQAAPTVSVTRVK